MPRSIRTLFSFDEIDFFFTRLYIYRNEGVNEFDRRTNVEVSSKIFNLIIMFT